MNDALNHLKDYKNQLIAAVLVGMFVVSLFMGVPVLFSMVMVLWAGSVVYAIHDLKNRSAYLVFLLAFFLFLLGGEFFELYMGYPQEYNFTENLDQHAYACLIVSLLFLLLGFMGTEYYSAVKKPAVLGPYQPKKSVWSKIRFFSRMAMLICLVPYFLKTLDAALYTLKNGYLSYYTTYRSRLPGIFEVLSEMFTMFMFIYLATMPSKKNCMVPIVMYLANSVLAMLTGRRISVGIAVLVVLFYVIMRHYRKPSEKWINKKLVITVLIACPLAVLFLHMQRYLRYGDAVEGSNFLDMIISFLSQQGFSINILKLQKELEGDPLGCTSLYYTIHYLRGNVITRHLFDFPMEYYTTRTVETALQTNCLADYIQYKVSAEDFFAGYGLGTSFIAELHHDLGFFGIALGSAFYGALLNGLFSVRKFSFWRFVVGMMMLEEFVIMPRYGADVFMRPFYNLTKMAVLAVFILLVYASKDTIETIKKKISEGRK